MYSVALTAGILFLGSVLVAPTNAQDTTHLVSFGVLEFVKPILFKVVNESTLVSLQTTIGKVVKTIQSGNVTAILDAVLSIVDSGHVVQTALKMLSNYEGHLWDNSFRRHLEGIIKGISKASSSGIACFSQNIERNLNNFTLAVVAAMNHAFAANNPNTTEPPTTGIAGAPKAILNSARLLLDLLTGSTMREAVINGLKGIGGSFQEGIHCIQTNTTEISNSWHLLTTQLSETSASGTSGAATASNTASGTSGTGTSNTAATGGGFFFG